MGVAPPGREREVIGVPSFPERCSFGKHPTLQQQGWGPSLVLTLPPQLAPSFSARWYHSDWMASKDMASGRCCKQHLKIMG